MGPNSAPTVNVKGAFRVNLVKNLIQTMCSWKKNKKLKSVLTRRKTIRKENQAKQFVKDVIFLKKTRTLEKSHLLKET